MNKKLGINLPVADLKRSIDLYAHIGFTNQFSDDTSACMVLSDEIFLMLMTHEKFTQLSGKEIGETQRTASSFYSLSLESSDAVNDFVSKAVKAGAAETSEPEDHGFLMQRSMADPDGHLWNIMYMDLSKLPQH